ncbi:MAG: endonuclease/exonuclease/phosphatase family protein [Solirubrobacterales bacterium]|nr:endonuclease/exonuclease/phosphatase family protein [Solirubrobacterales bacterium]MCB0860719.1 endonuclease/exonuclease/phosphatase family protein [Solirubrobacterales bacterium]HRV60170.1 endonuclease/exonuclease/phosphatase family protein [Solirubrobacterales bacterium]
MEEGGGQGAARERSRRRWVSAICWTLAGFFMLWAILRIGGLERGYPLVQMVAYTPYVLMLSLLALLVVVLCRRWLAAGFLAIAVIALALAVLPRAIGGPESMPGARPVRILTFNLAKSKAETRAVVEEAARREVDLIFLQELTRKKARELNRAGLGSSYPHQVMSFSEKYGNGIWSRWPLIRRESLPVKEQPRADVRVPDSIPIEVVSAHPTAPIHRSDMGLWERDYGVFPPAFSAGIPIVLAGDFNATLDHANLRNVIDTGYRDAAEVIGDGLAPTWPSTIQFPPPVTIDHVLAEKGIAFSQYDVVKIPGSDHKAIFTEILLPPVAGENGSAAGET